ncbi:MAG: complex I NDUFA9 subunit family protein [Pseudomonadota bacterium]
MQRSDQPKLVTVFGGSGFVGRHVVRALAKRGYRVRVAVRRPDLAFHLQPLGNVGQIKAMQTNLRYQWTVDRAVEGADTVINLVGILQATGKQSFSAVQERGAAFVAEAARKQGASLVHVSAIGADRESESEYGRTKGAAEAAVHGAIKDAVIMRPSIIFGPEDDFFNRFASMARMSPFLPLIGGGHTKFQPVFVGDVAEAVALAVDGKARSGKTYELGGPEIVSFRDCLEIMMRITDRNRTLVSIPWSIAKSMAKLTGWLPGAPITYDQVVMLESDNVVSDRCVSSKLTLKGLGISPRSMDSVLPSYLVRFRPSGQFTRKGAV